MTQILPPINLLKWIEKHRQYLKPPVCNKLVFEEQGFFVMVVGGPNTRKDYHVDEGPELFYQLEGDMLLKTIQQGQVADIPIRQGEMFLLPPRVPHSPQRFANTIGLVVERRRTEEELDGLQWYCDKCNHLLYEEFFKLRNIEKDFPPVFERFFGSEENRRCDACGHLMAPPEQKAEGKRESC